MKIDTAAFGDVYRVARFMRSRDIYEFLAVSPMESHEGLVMQIMERYGNRNDLIVAKDHGEAVAIGGLIQHRPNVATLLFFATDGFPAIALGLTRFIRQKLFPRVKRAGIHRIEAISIAGYHETHRWIEILGLKREAEFKGYGKNGETFVQFAWVSDAVPSRH